VADTGAQAEMLANRLRKTARHRRKWAKREDVSCYRVYDRDIPEIPLAIDWYDGRIHVARFRRSRLDDDPRDTEEWMAAMAAAAGDALGAKEVFTKDRQRQRGVSQYERVDGQGQRFVVEEGGYRFYVNLADYLDTGLFLDHRLLRARVGRQVAGKRLLNLFCYTGAFTVHAAGGGAAHTVSVDLSNTYLSWARDNLELNDAPREQHELLRADVREYLDDARRAGDRFDVIVADPPTFSNSKRAEGDLDLQRDHVALLRRCADLLRPGGVIYFSTNNRKLRLDIDALSPTVVAADITETTTGEDYRARPAHRCWLLEPSPK
jgi:23S rRNA G2069 N7-methylase RlmK/C1962 C5-methylase RlmI